MATEALTRMEQWLAAIHADDEGGSAAERVIRNRPDDLSDACWSSPTTKIEEQFEYQAPGACETLYPTFGDTRTAAGGGLAGDTFKCQLRPLDLAAYAVTFTADQQARLRATFPTGVCDWSQPGVGAAAAGRSLARLRHVTRRSTTAVDQTRKRQKGCPAGSSITRTPGCGWCSASRGSGGDGVGDRRVEVVDLDLEVDHLVLLTGLLRPHRRAVPLLGLDQQVRAAGRIPQGDPAGTVAGGLLVSEQAAVERGELLGIDAVDAHPGPPQRGPADRTCLGQLLPLRP